MGITNIDKKNLAFWSVIQHIGSRSQVQIKILSACVRKDIKKTQFFRYLIVYGESNTALMALNN